MPRRKNPKHLFTLSAILICALAIVWLGRERTSAPADPDPEQMESGSPSEDLASTPATISDDATTAAFLAQANRGEALSWLTDSHSSRCVARWDKAEALALIRNFYKAGAPQVYVVDTVQVAETEVASQFVVVLPTDANLRKQIFTCEADFEAEYDEDPTPDTGQKYLHLTTD